MLNERNIKSAFSKVKGDINLLNKELKLQKNVIITQNNAIIGLNGKLSEILIKLNEILRNLNIEKLPKTDLEIKKSVNQSINQSLINQSITSEENEEIEPIKAKKEVSIGNEGVNQSFNHLINQQSITNQSFNQSNTQLSNDTNFLALKNNLESVFRLLSKQELKVFLTIYQLEDDNSEPNYFNISQKMKLSEHCIRSHISSLMKKNTPLVKKRLNNRTNIINIRPNFKALNLKQRLINIYYETDPQQTTLFDVK